MIDVVLASRRAFIGYPPRRRGHENADKALQSALLNLSTVSDTEWGQYWNEFDPKNKNYLKQVSGNRNLIYDAIPGSIILVPRPDRGLVYAGTVDCFQLEDDPLSYDWGQMYCQLRYDVGLNKPGDNMASHIQDLAQTWIIKEEQWVEIPFVAFPTWMQKSFFGRSTSARLRGYDHNKNEFTLQFAYEKAKQLKNSIISGQSAISANRTWTIDPLKIKSRLLETIGASAFEHLVVALLQLEFPDEYWIQCGGSGDGGIDGLGTDAEGNVSLLQCKWQYSGYGFQFSPSSKHTMIKKRFFAVLVHDTELECADSVEFWGIEKISSLIIKHSRKLPWAMTMRIGDGVDQEEVGIG